MTESTDLLDHIRRLWSHRDWADEVLSAEIDAVAGDPRTWREYTHVLAAEETWLARLEGRAASVGVWPDLDRSELEDLRSDVGVAYRRYLAILEPDDLQREVDYTNSAGDEFRNTVLDILTHVALHGQYHRGKINLMLRVGGSDPVPFDYIGWVRGSPAATEADADRS